MFSCTECGSNDLYTDNALGNTACMSCGAVCNENITVASLEFTESKGSSSLTGQMVNLQRQQSTKPSRYFNLTATNNYLEKVEGYLIGLTETVGLPYTFATQANRWFKLMSAHKITKAKGIVYSMSVCLYIVTRMEQTSFMIIDITSALRIDCTAVAKLFLSTTKKLGIKVPLIDPSLFIPKYVHRLLSSIPDSVFIEHYVEPLYGKEHNNNSFDNKKNLTRIEYEKEIIAFANRIVKWMKRDWVLTGRRPNNICGAAILLANRIAHMKYNAFNENIPLFHIEEVARIVKGGVTTINSRIREIRDTKSADLTVEEFMRIWIEKEEDPPICKKHRKKEIEEEMKMLELRNKQKKVIFLESDTLKENFINKKQVYTSETQSNSNYENTDSEIMNSYDTNYKLEKENEINDREALDTKSNSAKGVYAIYDTQNTSNEVEINNDDNYSTDSEMEEIILNDVEAKKKEEIWNKMYGEFVKEKESRVTKTKVAKKTSFCIQVEEKEKKKTTKLNRDVLDSYFN